MVKRLTKHGNSLALVIERPILELLRIDAYTPLEISTDGESLIIYPIRDAQRQERFKKALESTNRRYSKALEKLAEQKYVPATLKDDCGIKDQNLILQHQPLLALHAVVKIIENGHNHTREEGRGHLARH